MGHRTAVYRLYNSADELLYVGMGGVRDRLTAHAREKPWWSEVDQSRTRVVWYPSRPEAQAAETAAIRTENPRYNVLGTPEHSRRMVAARRRMVCAGTVARRPALAFTQKLAGNAEIAARLAISRQRVQQLTARADWPAPLDVLAMGKVWRTEDIEAWIAEHRPDIKGEPRPDDAPPPGRRHRKLNRDT